MLLPIQSTGVERFAPTHVWTGGAIAPAFCTPCVFGKRICGLPFSPRIEDCESPAVCTDVTPCIPFINRKVRCCVPGGCSIVPC
jgi:hypothetical protein